MRGARGAQRTSRLTRKRAGRAGQACGRALGARADVPTHGAAGWALLCAPGRASLTSWVLVHPAWFFNPVFRLGIFPESLNEHCSL